MTLHRPRVLDSTAVLALIDGHPSLMMLMGDAAAGDVVLLVPTLSIGHVQRLAGPPHGMWEHLLSYRGLRSMPLVEHVAIEAGRLAGMVAEADEWGPMLDPMTIGSVAYEAGVLDGVVVTSVPAAYARFGVSIYPIR